jgi:hypothetical protein
MEINPAALSSIGFWILFAGLVGEGLVILFVSSGKLEKALSVVCTVVIIVGIGIERVGDKQRFGPRRLTPKQQENIAIKLKRFAGERIDVLAYQGDVEPWFIADQIAAALGKPPGAGWTVRFGRVKEINRAFNGMLVETTPRANVEDKNAAKALVSALIKIHLSVAGPFPVPSGLAVEAYSSAINGINDEPIHLTVGPESPP